jgi:hypothetical protein
MTTEQTLKKYPHIEQTIRLKIRGENLCRRYWRTHQPAIMTIAEQFNGKKVKLSNGGTSKPFKDAIYAVLERDTRAKGETIDAYLTVTDYNASIVIRACIDNEGVGCTYHETHTYIMNVKDGIGEALIYVDEVEDLNADEQVKLWTEADNLQQQYNNARDKVFYAVRQYLK